MAEKFDQKKIYRIMSAYKRWMKIKESEHDDWDLSLDRFLDEIDNFVDQMD